ARTRPSAGGTGARATRRHGRRGPCRRTPPSARRRARTPKVFRRGAARMPTRRGPRGSGSRRTSGRLYASLRFELGGAARLPQTPSTGPLRGRNALRSIPGKRRPKLRVLRVVLLGALEILRRVHRDPQALVAEAVQLPLVCELRERRLLVIAALRQALERLVV